MRSTTAALTNASKTCSVLTKLHTPDLAHLALKPFALLICYLVGTRNHQAQLLIPLKGQHSQGPDDRSQAFIAQGQSFRTTEADLY
jgi:hypothetical protein